MAMPVTALHHQLDAMTGLDSFAGDDRQCLSVKHEAVT